MRQPHSFGSATTHPCIGAIRPSSRGVPGSTANAAPPATVRSSKVSPTGRSPCLMAACRRRRTMPADIPGTIVTRNCSQLRRTVSQRLCPIMKAICRLSGARCRTRRSGPFSPLSKARGRRWSANTSRPATDPEHEASRRGGCLPEHRAPLASCLCCWLTGGSRGRGGRRCEA